jgi:hypothetical protein
MSPYLVVFGGEAMNDLADLWVLNMETLEWKEVAFVKGAVRPCGRRFHSSCLIDNKFYVISGCHFKYKPLSSVYSMDLSPLRETGSTAGLEWKEEVFNEQGFLARWGQSIAVQDHYIYIFGGRFSNDLNDLLALDTSTNKLKVLKVSPETIPKPRRRSTLSLIGSCLLMFGGFNLEYYNDLYYLNIAESQQKCKRPCTHLPISHLINNKQFANLEIRTKNGKRFYCHKGILMQYFPQETSLANFLTLVEGAETE